MFRVLATAPEYEPQFVTKVDPTNGLMKVILKKQNLTGLGPKNKLTGRILNPEGKPIEGAKVEFEGIQDANGGCGGACEGWGVQPLAVTDRDGSFLLTARRAFELMDVSVEARALAKRKFQRLASGTPHTLRLMEGTAVTGRVVRDGRPLPHATVGLVSVDRSESFTGEYEIASNEEGRFAFPNIPPGQKYYVYTRMSDARANGGVAPVQEFRADDDKTTTSVGDLSIRPGYEVVGRVRLAEGKPIPAGTRMWLGREEAWDTLANVDVPADGLFRLEGVPAETVTVGVRLKGYRLSEQNPSLDPWNPFRLIGRVETNLENFVILLEPGEFGPNHFKDRSQPKNKPLRGASAR